MCIRLWFQFFSISFGEISVKTFTADRTLPGKSFKSKTERGYKGRLFAFCTFMVFATACIKNTDQPSNTDQPIILSVPKWLKTKAYLSHEPLHISEQEEDIFHLSLVALHELVSAHMCTCTLLKLALSVRTRASQDTFPGNCIKRGNPSATDQC